MCNMAPPSLAVAIVLVRARNPLNIGAAARAMSNFGFADLRIVTDYPVPFQDAKSAVNAAAVLHTASIYPNVGAAVAGCTLIYGTSALGDRRLEHPVDLLRHAAERIIAAGVTRPEQDATPSGHAPVAILFGSEKTGLSNEELSFCHRLLTIPMHQGGVSMNLGQAVAVCLYELMRESDTIRMLPQQPATATTEQIERLESLLREVLLTSEYDRRFPGNLGERDLRQLLRRLALPASDTAIWLGMLRQVLWKLRQ